MDRYIGIDAALSALCQVSAPTPSESYIVEKCIDKINGLPILEVVRCKDCTFCKVDNSVFMKDVFGNENETPNYHCLKGYGYNKPNHFCSYGKRRTDNG